MFTPRLLFRSQDSDKDSTRLTDVTAGDITVTLRESRSSAGFFKQSVH